MGNRLFYRTVSKRLNLALILALLASMLLSSWPQTSAAAAATITVNSPLDSLANDGKCTLREAVIAANKNRNSGSKPGECAAGSGVDTILLPSGTFTLTRTDNGKEDSSSTGDLDVLQGVTIAGAGADVTTITAANYTDRIFQYFAGRTGAGSATGALVNPPPV